MADNQRPPKAGSVRLRGTAATREKEGGEERIVGTVESEWEFDSLDDQPAHLTGSVGFQVSVGKSTQFAREKIEVSVWCTLPAAPDRAGMHHQLGLAKRFAADEAQAALNELGMRFFPSLWSGDGQD